MKKKISILLMSILLLMVVAACGGNNSNSSSEDVNDNNNANENNANENTNSNESETDFPEKSITLVVPYAAGGGTDMTARALANAAEKILGQSIGVVNKEGGNAVVGMTEVANADPDGYTIILNASEIALLPHMGISPIDYTDFDQVAQINFDPAGITVQADAPYDTVDEFLEYAKENPGEIKVGGTGKGGIWHLAAATIEKVADVEFNFVPYDGAAPAKTALLGGHVEAITVSPAEVLPQVEAGELKMLSVLADERSPVLPDVPTFQEAGYDAEVGVWRALDAPVGTPPEVIKVLEEAFIKATEDEDFLKFMDDNGLGIVTKGSEEYTEMVKRDHESMGELLKELGITD